MVEVATGHGFMPRKVKQEHARRMTGVYPNDSLRLVGGCRERAKPGGSLTPRGI